MKCGRKSLRLYAVTDRSWLRGSTLEQQVEEALPGRRHLCAAAGEAAGPADSSARRR